MNTTTTNAKSTRYGLWQLKKLQKEFKELKQELFRGGAFTVMTDSKHERRYMQLLGYFMTQFRNDEWQHPLGAIACDGDEVKCATCGEPAMLERDGFKWMYDCEDCCDWSWASGATLRVAGYSDPLHNWQCVLLVEKCDEKSEMV